MPGPGKTNTSTPEDKAAAEYNNSSRRGMTESAQHADNQVGAR